MDSNITKRTQPALDDEAVQDSQQAAQAVLPQYQCHKIVQAARITSVDLFTDHCVLHHDNVAVGPLVETLAWHNKHRPQPGGYYVVYEDGYTSWSPAEAFEGGYRILDPAELLDFGDALHFLEAGKRLAREGWNGKHMWIALQVPDPDSKMTAPYIYMRTADGSLIPWLASQSDMLARDWRIVD